MSTSEVMSNGAYVFQNKVLTIIGATCIITIVVCVIIELAVQFGYYNHSCAMGADQCPTLSNVLVIIIGGIPIGVWPRLFETDG